MYFADDKGNGPIHYAIRASDESMVRLLMANTPELSWWHVAQGHTDPREYHLNYFCDVGAFSPLGLAVILLKYDMAVCLIDMGAGKSVECEWKNAKKYIGADRNKSFIRWSISYKTMYTRRGLAHVGYTHTGH